MADLPDLADQYNGFMELEPIKSLIEIKYHSKYRINGTIADFHPTGGRKTQENTPTQSGVWRGNITLDFIIQESEDEVQIVARFSGEDGQTKYNEFNQFLKGLKKAGLMKYGYTEEELKEEDLMEEGLMGEDLNKTGVIEIGMGTGNSKRDKILYMLNWINDYFVRGSERPDFLQRFHYENALGKGLIKLPENNGEE